MKTVPKLAAYAIVFAGALIMLAPFYFMFVFATQSRTDIFNVPPPLASPVKQHSPPATSSAPPWTNQYWLPPGVPKAAGARTHFWSCSIAKRGVARNSSRCSSASRRIRKKARTFSARRY